MTDEERKQYNNLLAFHDIIVYCNDSMRNVKADSILLVNIDEIEKLLDSIKESIM